MAMHNPPHPGGIVKRQWQARERTQEIAVERFVAA